MSHSAPDSSTTDDSLIDRIHAALVGYTRFAEGCPAPLAEAIRYGLLGPGKRLRPQMVIWAAGACAGLQEQTVERALPAACAVEMIHAYSLIHDDLPAMDDDDLRRGRPTCHKVFGESTAILAGDSLLALAFEVLARDVQPAELAARCCCELAHAAGATELVGGQADDLAAESLEPDVDLLQSIHHRKTGAMFRVSLRLGGLIAGATKDELTALDEYGRRFGLVFQITDDLLDVAGREELVGKRVGKDACLGKMTFPRLLGIGESRLRAQDLVREACESIERFGEHGRPLVELAHLIVARNR